jgi:hypothetical protein
LVAVIDWHEQFFPLSKEDYPEDISKKPELKLAWTEWAPYFAENRLLREFRVIACTDESRRQLVKITRRLFIKDFDLLTPLMEFCLEEKLQNRVEVFCVIFTALAAMAWHDLSEKLEQLFTRAYELVLPKGQTPVGCTKRFVELFLAALKRPASFDTKSLQKVLSILHKLLSYGNIFRLGEFMPFFRSFLWSDPQHFVKAFVDAQIMEVVSPLFSTDTHDDLLDELAGFCQVLIIAGPIDVFGSQSFLLRLRDLAMIPRLHHVLAPCFKMGLWLFDKCALNAIEQICAVFRFTSLDVKVEPLVLELASYVNLFASSASPPFIQEIRKLGLFEAVACYAKNIKNVESLISALTVFTSYC